MLIHAYRPSFSLPHRKDIPTLRDEPRDPLTADAVVSSQDKAMVLRVARSVVSVSSITPDGGLIFQCTGIVFGWDGANKCAKILTSSSVVCDFKGELHDPTLKVHFDSREQRQIYPRGVHTDRCTAGFILNLGRKEHR
uniref:Uncharacterized protein n=1 Tax=Oryza meridionalis TaxID=40149 RepID=A0A0E0EHT2_9ORYZ